MVYFFDSALCQVRQYMAGAVPAKAPIGGDRVPGRMTITPPATNLLEVF